VATRLYSVRFFAEVGLNGTRAYAVQAGFRAVVRDIDVYASAGFSPKHARFFNSAGGTIKLFQVDPDTAISSQWTGRQVFEAGELIAVTTDGPMDVTVSGYLLTVP
jgi:hypothetical protein